MTKYDLEQKSSSLHWLVLLFPINYLKMSYIVWKTFSIWKQWGIFIAAGDPFISFDLRIIGIFHIQLRWLANVLAVKSGKALSSQMCSLTNWRSHTVFLLISLYNRNSSCSLLECPVSLLFFPFFLSSCLDLNHQWEEEMHAGRGMCHM